MYIIFLSQNLNIRKHYELLNVNVRIIYVIICYNICNTYVIIYVIIYVTIYVIIYVIYVVIYVICNNICNICNNILIYAIIYVIYVIIYVICNNILIYVIIYVIYVIIYIICNNICKNDPHKSVGNVCCSRRQGILQSHNTKENTDPHSKGPRSEKHCKALFVEHILCHFLPYVCKRLVL